MSYKTILVHVDESKHLEKRVQAASKIAVNEQAHLIGVAATAISQALHRPAVADSAGGNMPPYRDDYIEALRRRAAAALDQFETLAHKAGVSSEETRLIDDDAATAVSEQGKYADLIVLGQSDAQDPSLTARVDFPEYVILNSECPVLVVPAAEQVVSIGERTLIAWNGGTAASRAVRNAMPFLKQAKSVHIAVIDTAAIADQPDGESGAELAAFLRRHGIEAEVVRRTVHGDAGHALLSLASELSSDLLVMGCIAHPRSRGMLLGGSTRVVLESATIPLLMSR